MGGATLPYLYFIMIDNYTLDQLATRLEYTKPNDFAKGSLGIKHIQDTDPVGREAKDVRTYSDNGFSDKGSASITYPIILFFSSKNIISNGI